MSIDPLKDMGLFQIKAVTGDRAERSTAADKAFDRVLEENLNGLKSLDIQGSGVVEMARLAQLRMLQGLFVGEEGEQDDGFSGLEDVMQTSLLHSRQSQIIDKYYAATQPSLSKPQETGRDAIDRLIDRVAEQVSLAPELIRSVVTAESAYDPTAVSHAGAQGLMQLMPDTARELGVRDSFDPFENLLGGSRYLKQLLDKYDGDLDHALAAYNWGQGNVDRHGLAKMPEETRNYLTRVKGRFGEEANRG